MSKILYQQQSTIIPSNGSITTSTSNGHNSDEENKKKKYRRNTNILCSNPIDYDEIGEEFEFSDNDLIQLNGNVDKKIQLKDGNGVDNKQEISKGGLSIQLNGNYETITPSLKIPPLLGGSKNPISLHGDPLNTPFFPISPTKIVDCIESDKFPIITKNVNEHNGKSYNTHGDDAADDEEYYSDEPEDELIVQFLGQANQIAEARLAARRQARAEAREIRMRELERQQKEQEQNADRVFDMHTAAGIDPLSRSRLTAGVTSSVGSIVNSVRAGSMSSRRSSEDSLEEEGRSLRDIRHELKDVEERFRKAMIANAQLDNERASQSYQIQLLKDKLEEMEESYAQLQREYKEKTRDYNALKRNLDKVSEELKLVQGQLDERDTLITEQGLVIVAVENDDGSDAKRALVTVENAQLLGSVQGSLDVRLKKFIEEKQQLQSEVQNLQEQLENFKTQGRGRGNSMNGPLGLDDDYEAQREANKVISDYKYKLQKAEQEIASLQASLARSETQVIRYKSTAEAAEKAEAELKIERRKLQRENREAMERLEELETSNNHLLKRLDKLKNAKSALLKDL